MSPFPLRGTWTGEASIHQFPLPIPPSLFLRQSFYFTSPPSTFTLQFEPLTQPSFVLLVGSANVSVFQNSLLFLPISLRRSLPFYPSVLTLGSVLDHHVLLFSSAGLPVFPAIPFLPLWVRTDPGVGPLLNHLGVECSPPYLLSTCQCRPIVKSPPPRLLCFFPALISICLDALTSFQCCASCGDAGPVLRQRRVNFTCQGVCWLSCRHSAGFPTLES